MFQSQSTSTVSEKKENPLLSWYKLFSSQPHQPFFFNGVLFFMLFIGVLWLSYNQSIPLKVSLTIFHGYALIFVVFFQFFLGFLFVVFPRFLMQAEITSKVYMNQFKLYFFATVLFFISLFVSESLCLISGLILLVAQILSLKVLFGIYKKSLMQDKYDTQWILIAFSTGILSHGFFIIAQFDFSMNHIVEIAALYSGFYLFLFTLIFTISQRMIPFFTSMKSQGYVINKSKYLMEIVFGLLVLKVMILLLEQPELNLIADIPLCIFFVREFFKWKLPLRKTIPIMWVLYLSIYWIPLGFLLSSIESFSFLFNSNIVFEKSVIHTFAIGYFITILFGFGTRVVLGHSGRTPTADKLTIVLFIAVQGIVLLRIFASFSMNFNMDYVFWINASAIALLIVFAVWSIKYVPILIKLK